ncbi:MAG: A/G-specific adenine glycosylase [Pseudomonadota bacterium]
MSATRPLVEAADLLSWYDRHARVLPWRISPKDRAKGISPDPYRIWLSEVMLQQTTIAAVKDYFERFTNRWPSVEELASAERDDVLGAWAGLGYYSRARNLKACANLVASEYGGIFPDTEAGLKALPGIGDYTAAAIAAIAFDEPATVVDGNVERVITRLHALEEPLPGAKKTIRKLASALTPDNRPGDYAQAVMDLGATLCTPRKPACALCPWSEGCEARRAGNAERYPLKKPKGEKPTRFGHAFVAIRRDGAVLLRKRPDKGLLGGMSEVPGSDWHKDKGDLQPAATLHPFDAQWQSLKVPVLHTFTHFHLQLFVHKTETPLAVKTPYGCYWAPKASLATEALPSVMKKVIEAALPGHTRPSP